MRDMTPEEWSGFLNHGTRTGKLAIVLSDGRPTVTPVWFVLDDDGVIRFTTDTGTVKEKVLRRDPRACLVVDLEEPPYAFVRVEGTVSFDDDLDHVRAVATRLGGRYMGADRAAEFGARNGVPGELVAELRITRVVAKDDVSG
jgi:PPOX class probable F420-dependent enzyme